MQFEGYRRSSHVPNLTPLIDIVFLLLIFFMLTSHFVREDTINIDLPVAETGDKKENNKVVEIIVREDGAFLFDNNVLSSKDLELTLKEKLTLQQNKVVRIKGDRAASLGVAVELIDITRKAGAEGVDIVTEKNEHH